MGIILFGSRARGDHREESDADLVVILNNGYRRAVENHHGLNFEIIYTTAEASLEFWSNNLDDAYNLWDGAKVVYQRNNEIECLRDKALKLFENGKPIIDDHRRKQMCFDAEDQIRFIEDILDSDPLNAEFLLSDKISLLTAWFFDLRALWTPAPKKRLEEINRLAPHYYDLLKEFYSTNLSTKQKVELAKKMVIAVFVET